MASAPASLAANDEDWWDVAIPIMEWCKEHVGCILPITNEKDFGMVQLWDDRCTQVLRNTGIPVMQKEREQ